LNFLSWIRKFFAFGNGIFAFAGALVFSVVLINQNPGGKWVFHEVLISTLLLPVQGVVSQFTGSILIHAENKRLRHENTRLRLENDRFRQSLLAVPRRHNMLQWADSSSLNLKAGRILALEAGRFGQTWVINLGLRDSVDINMPVLTEKGIVGKIVKCFPFHSLVQVITDPGFKASVRIHRSRARGILESWRVGTLGVRVPSGTDLQAGDTLVTTGLGGVFPEGLVLGVTGDSLEEVKELGQVETWRKVKLFQDPNRVEELFVLIREDNWILKADRQ
jgi:rod shape-determining protein MreC